MVQGADGSFHPFPEPKEFSLYATGPDPSSYQWGWTVWIKYPNGGGGTMFGSGHLNGAMRRLLYKAWFIPGDRKDSPMEQAILPDNLVQNPSLIQIAPGTPLQEPYRTHIVYDGKTFAIKPGTLPGHLIAIAKAVSIPLLFLLPDDASDIGAPPKSRVSELLDNMQSRLIKIYKWRDDILLLSSPEWFTQ